MFWNVRVNLHLSRSDLIILPTTKRRYEKGLPLLWRSRSILLGLSSDAFRNTQAGRILMFACEKSPTASPNPRFDGLEALLVHIMGGLRVQRDIYLNSAGPKVVTDRPLPQNARWRYLTHSANGAVQMYLIRLWCSSKSFRGAPSLDSRSHPFI